MVLVYLTVQERVCRFKPRDRENDRPIKMFEIFVFVGVAYPVRTQYIHTTSSQRYGHCIDVETTLCETG